MVYKDKFTSSQIIVLGFILLIVIGAALLSLPIAATTGKSTGFITSVFTSTSAVCVTGLVVVDTGTYWSVFGKTVIMLLIQAGGLGFMTITSFFFIALGNKITFKQRLAIKESLNEFHVQGIVRFVKYIGIMTMIFEGVGSILYAFKFIPQYGLLKGMGYSVFHAISAFCNAGFDLIGGFSSFTDYTGSILINITTMLLIIFGGLGYTVIYDIFSKRELKKFSFHSLLTIKMTIGFIIVGSICIFALEFSNMHTLGMLSLKGKILAAFFQSVTPRTAGFNTIAINQLTIGTLILMMFLMFVGGSSASTAGGIKITTAGVMFFKIVSVIQGKKDTEFHKKRIDEEVVNRAIVVTILSGVWVILVTLLLSIIEKDMQFIQLLFEAVSSFGTVGLSMGITPSLSDTGKLLIVFSMFVGRVGPLTLVLALAAKQRSYKRNYHYPKDKIMVG